MAYETTLEECGSSGAHPSPIWGPVTGFGGDGVPGIYTVPPNPTNISLAFRKVDLSLTTRQPQGAV